jgi:hypothetical protein
MSRYYLVPTESATIFGQQASVPEYLASFVGTWTALPFGVEPLTLVSLTSDNPTLDAADDVFSFPADLTQVLTDNDVAAIGTFFSNVNLPSDFAVTGMEWSFVLRQVALVHLLAQALAGASGGLPIFTGTGVTLDSTVATQNLSQGKGKTGGTVQSTPNALATAVGGQVNGYDLSDVSDDDVVSDVLLDVSSQFQAPILLGAAGAI